MPRTFIDGAICPACQAQGMEYNAEQIDLPYLGNSLETLIRCPQCGYRHTDFILTETKDPTRVTMKVGEEQDLMVRVVRSASGTVRIPEMGISIEPGVASEAFISNIEGIIVRIERVLDQLHRDAESDEVREKVEAMQEHFGKMRTGEAEPITVIMEDPFGNSSIISEKAKVEPIPEEEANLLKTGMFVIDPTGQLMGEPDEAGGPAGESTKEGEEEE